jgi:hypothetical protein
MKEGKCHLNNRNSLNDKEQIISWLLWYELFFGWNSVRKILAKAGTYFCSIQRLKPCLPAGKPVAIE